MLHVSERLQFGGCVEVLSPLVHEGGVVDARDAHVRSMVESSADASVAASLRER